MSQWPEEYRQRRSEGQPPSDGYPPPGSPPPGYFPTNGYTPPQQYAYPPQGAPAPGYKGTQAPLPGHTHRKRPRKRNVVLLIIAAFFVVGVIGELTGNGKSAKPVAETGHVSAKSTIVATPTAHAKSSHGIATKPIPSPSGPATKATPAPSAVAKQPSFPPSTVASFRAFAATGDASQVHQIATSTEGLPSCPNPNTDVIVSPRLAGKALEADLAAFFVQSGFLGNQCQAFVFAYHGMSDYRANENNGFTAGRVALTTNGGSGPQHNLEVDTGPVTSELTEFDFNF